MKKVLASVIAFGCLGVAGASFAGLPAATGVNGSLHDMNAVVGANADSMGRVCVFCHTPHNAESNVGQMNTAPLWNHDPSTRTYQAYEWVTPLNMVDESGNSFEITGDNALAGPSRLCMSCHDGVVSVDQHGKAVAQPGTKNMSQINFGRADLGGDLTKTHPIGFDYVAIRLHRNTMASVASAGDSEIVDPEKSFATAVATDGTVQGQYNVVTREGNKRIKDVLFGGTIMTCASCHEVHNKENAVQDDYKAGFGLSGAPNYFLYAKQQDSLICLSCHVK